MRPPTPFSEMYRVDASGCWIWMRGTDSHGYGTLRRNTKWQRAHRYSWEQSHGPIPAGMTVDHICFVPACVNPDHLQLLTNRDNAMRQRRRLATHCQRGHEYTPENTWTYSQGTSYRRTCKTCQRARIAERRAARAAA